MIEKIRDAAFSHGMNTEKIFTFMELLVIKTG